MFGVPEPDFYGLIRLSDGQTSLFAPHLSPEYEVWSGPIESPIDIKSKYEVDEVFFSDAIDQVVNSTNNKKY